MMDYKEINKNSWNNKVDIHVHSEFYDNEAFKAGKNSLKNIELELLGDLKGKSVLHLQCHFGQDTISLTRIGANATGIDISDKAIDVARSLSKECDSNAIFITCDIYDLPQYLDEKFDIVFTSYGTIGWLPDMDKWAKIVCQYLKPNGKFVFVEFHPVVWMFDDDFKKINYHYSKNEAIVESYEGTYAAKDSDLKQEYVMWNHGLAEVMSSLIAENLNIESFKEYDYSPYDCFKETEEFEPGKFRIKHFENKIPMVYSIVAIKDA